MTNALKWIAENSAWLVPLVIVLLSTLFTGLSNYKRTDGAAGIFRILADMLSVAQHYNSPGSLKMIGVRSTPPDGKAPPSTPADPPGVGLPLCLVLLMVLGSSACNPRQTAAWKALSADSLECFKPGATAALSGAVDGVIKDLTGTSTDWAAYGKGLVSTYGGSIALCILGQAAARLGPVIFGGVPEGDPRAAIGWLDSHRDKWLP